MNQNEQIIQVLSRALGTFGVLLSLTQNTTALHVIKEQIRDLNGAIDHVEKMQKTEHDSGDVLKKSGNVDMIREALRKAFDLGQIYWQQADSEYVSQYKKADATHALYVKLLKDTVQALAVEPAKLVRLTDEEILDCWMNVKGFPSEHTTRGFAHAIMDAMERKNGGTE